jgi:hypothetical protein
MGGYGSTRWAGWQLKLLVEKTPRVSIDNLYPRSKIKTTATVIVQKRADEGESYRQNVLIDLVPISRNGYRVRFICDCGRRVRYLFFVKGRMCCRKCGGLVHQSTRRSHDFEGERLFRSICREQNITGLSYGVFHKSFKRRSFK